MRRLDISRTPTPPTPGSDQLLAGSATLDITPELGGDTAGYSAIAKKGLGLIGHLGAHALVLRGPDGGQLALVHLDLMSATRYLHEHVAARTATLGLGVAELVLAGTHTHSGPGHFYGNTLYDWATAHAHGFDADLAEFLVDRIATAVERAHAALRPARVGVGVGRVWGTSRCAPHWAFEANCDARHWESPGWPGHGAPDGLSPKQRAVDPRVVALVARDAATDALLAVHATFAMHATALGPKVAAWSPDWPGFARRRVREVLGADVVVGLAGGASGDQTPMREGGELPAQGRVLAAQAGARVGDALVAAVEAAELSDRAGITVHLWDWVTPTEDEDPADRTVDGDPDTRLAPAWSMGSPSMAGAEEGRSGLPFSDPHTDNSFPPEDPRFPMADPKALLDLADLVGLDPSPQHPVHLVRVGDRAWATVPGEPSVVAAHRLERAVLEEIPDLSGAAVIGYAGDYLGYFLTHEEYRCQHYEAASMIFGRNEVRHHRALVRRLCRGATHRVDDSLIGHAEPMAPPASASPAPVEAAHLVRTGRQLYLHWKLPHHHPIRPWEGPLFHLEVRRGGDWVPLEHAGLPFDEAAQLLDVRVSRGVLPVVDRDDWSCRLDLPDDLPEEEVRVVFPPRSTLVGAVVEA